MNDLSLFLNVSIVIVSILVLATFIGIAIKHKLGLNHPVAVRANQRIFSWWIMVIFCLPIIYLGKHALTLFFAFISFLCLREFISLTPTKKGDRLPLFISFFVAIPIQFYLIWDNWYTLYSILIPVYGFFLLAALTTLHQDTENFLERSAKIQWAVMLCVYGISHIPAIYQLPLKDFHNHASLLLYFLLVAQSSDIFQYIFGSFLGKKSLSKLSPHKTWEGVLLGGSASSILGGCLYFMTPFNIVQSWFLSILIIVTGIFGGLILSGVKRSIGIKDWGNMIPGHGGVLDRVASLAISAPIFFHLVRYYFSD